MRQKRDFSKLLGETGFYKFFIIDVLVATGLGVVAWLITRESLLSLVVSLLLGIILLIVESRFQLVLAKEELASIIGFQQEALKDQFLLSTLRNIIKGYSGVLSSGDEFFLERTQELLRQCVTSVSQLQGGRMEIRPEESLYLISLIKIAQKSVFATSLVKAADFWHRGGGKEYHIENKNAIERGVKITRVFIVEDESELTSQVRALINEQVSIGVTVKVAFARNLSPDIQHDFGIFDEKYIDYLDLIPGSRAMRGIRFYRDEAEVRKAITNRDRILAEAEDALNLLKRTQVQQNAI